MPACPEPLKMFESNNIGSIIQDPSGFLYIGSRKGVYRFDGFELFPIITDEDFLLHSIPPKDMKIYGDSLFLVENDILYVNLQNPSIRSKINFGEENQNLNFSGLQKDKNGFFWFFFEEGVIVADLNTKPIKIIYENKTVDNGNDRYRSMELNNDFAYFTTSNGFLERYKIPKDANYTSLEIERVSTGNGRPNIFITDSAVYVLNNGIIKKLGLKNLAELQTLNNEPLTSGAITGFKIRNKDIIIQDDDSLRLFRFALDKGNESVKHIFVKSSNKSSKLFIDNSSVIWGYSSKGLWKLNSPGFNYKLFPVSKNGEKSDEAYSILIKDEWIYCGLRTRGLEKINLSDKRIIHIPLSGEKPEGITNIIVTSLLSSDGSIVSGGLGVNFLDLDEMINHWIIPLTDSNGLSEWIVWSMLEDTQGKFWFGTNYGLNFYDPLTGRIEIFKKDDSGNSLCNNHVWAIAEDNDGGIVLGTWNGISIFNVEERKFKNYTEKNFPGKENHSIKCLYVEPESGMIYAGTEGKGLIKLDPKTGKIISFTTQSGLISNTVWGIVPDSKGLLWLSTTRGIALFDPVKMEIKRNYTIEDGLPFDEFYFNAFTKDVWGTIYFGGTDGIIAFNPHEIEINPALPSSPFISKVIPVFKTKRQSKNRHLNAEYKNLKITSLKLKRVPDTLIIFSRTFHYQNPSQNLLHYKLEGQDTSWTVTRNGVFRFSNLMPGEFTLLIMAESSDGIKNPLITSIPVVIRAENQAITISILFTIMLAFILLFLFLKNEANRKKITAVLYNSLKHFDKSQSKNQLLEDECSEILRKIDLYLSTTKQYLKPEISLDNLAAELEIKRHVLSQAINQGSSGNYFDLINQYRINESKEMILSGMYEHLSLEGIAHKCGFNSKATFYAAFKKYNGSTPAAFRKQNSKNPLP